MSELPIVERLKGAGRLVESVPDHRTIYDAADLISELVEALEAARLQVKTLGTPDDAVNNHIIAVCDFAIAKAKQPI